MSDETALAAHQQEYAAATSEDAKRAAAAAAGSLLDRVEGDLFSSAVEVRAAMTARAAAARTDAARASRRRSRIGADRSNARNGPAERRGPETKTICVDGWR